MRTLSSWRARSAFGVVVLFLASPDAMGVSASCGGAVHRAKHSCSVRRLHQCPARAFEVGIPRLRIAARMVRAKDAAVRAVSLRATSTMFPLLPHKTAHMAQCCRAQRCSSLIS